QSRHAPSPGAPGAPARRGVVGLFRRLNRPVGSAGVRAVESASSLAVLSAPDAAARLFLDALDARGVRVDLVSTLWHAMAAAWCAESPADGSSVAAVLRDGPRLVWCWGRAGGLIVGGSVAMDDAADAPSIDRSVHRLALDWLSWSTHLGSPPSSIVVLGHFADALSDALTQRWPDARTRALNEPAPVATTLTRAASAPGADGGSPARALAGLSQRPTRASRTQFRWAAAALLGVAGAIGGLAYRLSQHAGALTTISEQARADAQARLKELNDPSIERAANPVKVLESVLTQAKEKGRVKLPPKPRAMHEELERLAALLAPHEGVRLIEVTLDRTNTSLKLKTPDRRTGEAIGVELGQLSGPVSWSVQPRLSNDQQLVLEGAWRN
ncbi:MAG TPA: hypothetical protein DEB06_00950, partial [Phycisphaerales bacterium]|nr:hypothetical protein [Phycisphaerales bacterium]